MLKPVQASLPIPVDNSYRYYQKPIVVLIALAALAALVAIVARSLRGRVQSSSPAQQSYEEGLVAFKLGQHAAAIQKFTQALSHHPDPLLKAHILTDRGITYQATQQQAEALEDFEEALKCEFNNIELRVDLHLFIGGIYDERNEPQLALQEYNQADGFKPLSEKKKAEVLFHRGCTQVVLKKFQEAYNDLSSAAGCQNLEPSFQADILAHRATALIGLARPTDALKDLEKALGYNPAVERRKQIHLQMAIVHDAREHPLQAIQAYTEALKCPPFNPDEQADILKKRATSFDIAKDPIAAGKDLEAAWNCHPINPDLQAEIQVQWGLLCYNQKDLDSAVKHLTIAVSCNPTNSVKAHFIRGQLYVMQKAFGSAIRDFAVAIDLTPTKNEWRAQLLHHRALAEVENNQKDEALRDLKEALSCRFPNNLLKARIFCTRAEVNAQIKNNWQGVIVDCTEALACNFDDPRLKFQLHRLRARAYRNTEGNTPKAIDDCTMIIDSPFLEPDENAELLYARGVAYDECQNKEQARKDWEKALRFATNPALKGYIEERLREKGSVLSSSFSALYNGASWMLSSISPFSSPQ